MLKNISSYMIFLSIIKFSKIKTLASIRALLELKMFPLLFNFAKKTNFSQ